MLKWILLLVGLNSADALLTYFAVGLGVPEANPIMAFLLEQGSIHFLVIKLILINVLAILLVRASQTYKIAKVGFIATVCLYTFIFAYHLVNLWALMVPK